MVTKLNVILIYLKLQLRVKMRAPLLMIVRLVSLLLKPGIILTYESNSIQDGVGAQAQRLLAIRGLAEYLKLSYAHTGIQNITIHPLDSHQDQESYNSFLTRLNEQFYFPSNTVTTWDEVYPEISTRKLGFRLLFQLLLRYRFGRRCIVRICECYDIVDTLPKIYSLSTHIIADRFVAEPRTNVQNRPKVIAVHYRSVPGSYSVYRGESRTRQLEPERIVKLVNKIIASNKNCRFEVRIFTDSPPVDLSLPVLASQEYLWRGTPGYESGRLYLKAGSIHKAFEKVDAEVNYLIGGDPLEAMIGMVNSDILIASKSSLSYVASLFFVGIRAYIPFEFWHTTFKVLRF